MTESNSESVTESEDFSFEQGSFEPSVEELAAALTHADQCVVVTSLAGKVRYINAAFESLTGFSPVEVIGKKPSLWKSGYHSAEFYSQMWKSLQLGKSWKGEVVNKKKSGELYFSDLTISPLKNSLGQTTGYVGFHHDITKRKKLSQELSKINASLAALSKEQALFFARLSHDMRTPLASILGICEFEPTPEMIQEIKFSAGLILDLVNDILDFSKLKEGKLPLLASPFSLDELLGGVLSVARPLARAKGLTLSVNAAYPNSKTHLGDIRRLRQVVLNLLSNAIKFTNQGQVRLNVSWDHGVLVCSVEDSGIGMSHEACERLFEDFVQLDHSANSSGSGLGLAICRQLIQLMGGQIGVKSQLQVGSHFWFSIPLSEGEDRRSTPEIFAPVQVTSVASESSLSISEGQVMPEGRTIHILIAEDDAIGRKVYKRFLDLPNLVIECVENGMNLVACGRRKAYDLIISDYYLPDVNGLEAIQLIRAELMNHLTPVIFATGTSLPQDLHQIKSLSMSSILSKPFSKRDLLQAVHGHLRLAQVRAN